MKVLIIEDEQPAARRLISLIGSLPQAMEVVAILDSAAASKQWLAQNPSPDLIFMDIQLSDDLSFAIFDAVEVKSPVIFTTAFDEYALRAFEVNSIDYLLKPIEAEKLEKSISKLVNLNQHSTNLNRELIQTLVQSVTKGVNTYRRRFLVKRGNQFITITVDDIAHFITENKVNFLVTKNGRRHIVDSTLDELESELDPGEFFRLNRQCIGQILSLESIHNYFNGKLKILLKHGTKEKEQTVSRDKAAAFKSWLDK